MGNRNNDWWMVLIFDLIMVAFVVCDVWKKNKSGVLQPFQYHITDLWALTIGLSPSLLLFANEWHADIALGLLLPHQLAGVALAWSSRTKSETQSPWSSAGTTILWAWVGLFLPLFSGMVFLGAVISLFFLPILLPVLIVGYAIKSAAQTEHNREELRQLRAMEKIDTE